MRRLVLALAVTFGLLVLTPSPSWACSCATADTAEQVRLAVTVAAGTVDWTATDGQTRTYNVDFDSVYKGAAARAEKLRTNAQDSACGLGHLATGRRYLFFIEGRHPGAMRVSLCGGTVAYDEAVAGQVESITGPPGRPLASPADTTADETDHSSRNALLGVGATVALVVLVAAAFVVRRGT